MTSANPPLPTAPLPYQYVVIEGPIGVGKTSLARRLAEAYGGELILEHAEENPFLERFYRQPKTAALPAQLYFLFQRSRQLQALRQQSLFRPLCIADFLLDKDRLFARVTLDDEEYSLYEQVYDKLSLDAPRPDLVVYLQAPVDVLQERIAKRGIRYEQAMERDYLQKLADAYAQFFHHYDNSPLLIVNVAEIDFIDNPSHFEQLRAEVARPRRGRHYFNPYRED